jgi:hypothetical protein
MEEDQLLISKIQECGLHWTYIARFFKSRTDTNIKNRWNLIQRKLHRHVQTTQDQYPERTPNAEPFTVPELQDPPNEIVNDGMIEGNVWDEVVWSGEGEIGLGFPEL